MLLQNEIEVALPVDQAWTVLTDLERIAPCLPGATLERRDGERYQGSVKIKVGPIGANFRGTAEYVVRDDRAHRAVISATGKDPKGQSTATAEVRAHLEPIGDGRTRVLIDTELDITGRMAQFGRGAIADISNRLLSQFAANLADNIADGTAADVPTRQAAADSAVHGAPAPSRRRREARPDGDGGDLDVMSLVVPMLKERYGQAILGGILGAVISWLLFGRKVRR